MHAEIKESFIKIDGNEFTICFIKIVLSINIQLVQVQSSCFIYTRIVGLIAIYIYSRKQKKKTGIPRVVCHLTRSCCWLNHQ